MAKKQESDVKTELPVENKEAVLAPSKGVGTIVHYYKKEAQSNGTYKMVPQAAIIIAKAEGNFHEKDHAVNLITWGKLGYPEVKAGVLHSQEPYEGRWTSK